MRFLLVDRVDELQPGQYVRGVKNVTLSEDFLQDHFPDHPLYPGTLVVEALAQLGGFLVECSVRTGADDKRRAVLAQIEKAKFHQPCRPGDQIELRGRLVATLEGAAQIEGEALVAGKRAAHALLMFRLVSVESDNVHRQRRNLYEQWTRELNPQPPIP